MQYRGYTKVLLVLSAVLVIGGSVPVQAGDINAAEQTVLDYMNQIFTVDGKEYQVSDSAKNSAYDKLSGDDTDLTSAQAKAAIRQAGKKVKQGVTSGYLVEVTELPGEAENTETERTEIPADTDVPGNTETQGQGQTPTTPAGETPTTPTTPTGETPNTSTTPTGETPTDTTRNPVFKPTGEKIDAEKLIDTLVDNQTSRLEIGVTDEEGIIYTVTDYQSGEVLVASEDGTLLYKSGLLLKNTGYDTSDADTVLILLAFGAILCVVGAIACIWMADREKLADRGKSHEEY